MSRVIFVVACLAYVLRFISVSIRDLLVYISLLFLGMEMVISAKSSKDKFFGYGIVFVAIFLMLNVKLWQ